MTDGASTASPAFIAYNNGYLHGAWTDADQDTNAIRAEINAMLARSEPEADSAIADFRNGLASIIGLDEIAIGLLHISDIRTLGMDWHGHAMHKPCPMALPFMEAWNAASVLNDASKTSCCRRTRLSVACAAHAAPNGF
jgi:hypothetical protein